MKLLVVYGLKTKDRTWLNGFYPVRRLAEACANRSIPLRFLFTHEVPDFLSGKRPDEVAASDVPSASDFSPSQTVCLIRGAVSDETWLQLEAAGYRCVNARDASAIALDKLETARFLEAHGWPTPKTVEFGTADTARAEPPMPCPFVVKPRFGSRGAGVALIESPEAFEVWRSAWGASEDRATEWIAQEYIATSRGKDLRVFFAGSEAIAAAERHGAPGDFRSNACTGGSMCAAKTEGLERWFALALDIAREAGLWYGTVDFLYRSENELTVCEINGSPGFEALELDLGLDIADAITDRLDRDFG
jgi:RimK family alpha-L-glutamate ligase